MPADAQQQRCDGHVRRGEHVLSAPAYLLGTLELTVALGGAAVGANRVRRRLLPGWSGPPAWVVDLLFAIALLIWAAELLGSFGLLDPVLFALLAAGAGAGLRAWVGPPERFRAAPPPAPRADRIATVAALGVAALLAAHWSIPTQRSLAHGMAGYDTLWYHGPFAVHFADGGSTFDYSFVAPRYLVWFYPANSELLNAVGILTVGRDTLSVLINMGWLGATLLAAWGVGRPYGAGPHSLIAVALLLDSGMMADQAGSGRNDTIAIFFILAAVAILVNARAASGGSLPWRSLVPAGLAIGLMVGTKVNLLAPAAALVVGIPLIALPGARRRALLAFGLPALAGGGYWYLRNLLHDGNPLPWVREIGTVPLLGPDQPLGGRPQFSIAHYLTDGSVWDHWFLPGLSNAMGVFWPLIAGLALFAIGACLARGSWLLRIIGLAALLGVAGWFFHGTSAEGPPGEPIGFYSSLRHVSPVLAVGLALAPLAPGLRSSRARDALLVGSLALLPFVDAEGIGWIGEYLVVAVVIGLAVFAALLAALRWRPELVSGRPAILAGAGMLVLAVVSIGAIQAHYLDHRYRSLRGAPISPPGLADAARWARHFSGQRIATTSDRPYALYGTDLSNTVVYPGRHHRDGDFTDWRTCPQWRRALNDGRFRYAVIGYDRTGPALRFPPPQARWIAADSAVTLLRRWGSTAIFRIDGRLDPAGCPRRARASSGYSQSTTPDPPSRGVGPFSRDIRCSKVPRRLGVIRPWQMPRDCDRGAVDLSERRRQTRPTSRQPSRAVEGPGPRTSRRPAPQGHGAKAGSDGGGSLSSSPERDGVADLAAILEQGPRRGLPPAGVKVCQACRRLATWDSAEGYAAGHVHGGDFVGFSAGHARCANSPFPGRSATTPPTATARSAERGSRRARRRATA